MGWLAQHPGLAADLQTVGTLAIYATAALVAAVTGGLVAAFAVAGRDHRRLLRRRVTAALVLSGVVATAVTVDFAWSTEYSTRTPVVLTETGLVAGTLVAGLVVAAWPARPSRREAAARGR